MGNIILYIFSIVIILIGFPVYAAEPEEKETLLNGWYYWDPYQYSDKKADGSEIKTGLDIELVKVITKAVGKKVIYEQVPWKQHQLDLKTGARDFAAGATFTDERAQYVYFSKPYRFEENSLFVRRDEEQKISFQTIDEFLIAVKQTGFRLGVIDGFIYADPKINKWLKDPANQYLITRETHDLKNINNLDEGLIDGFLADRIVGATLIWKGRWGSKINEIRLGIKTPIHLMFSKKTVPYALVEKFNDAIDQIKCDKQYKQIISGYLHPVLLMQTVDTTWFGIIEIIGTIAFAISGLVIAYRDRATIFGAFIFAVLPALGGGIIRDVIFMRNPVGAIRSPVFLLIVITTVLTGFILVRLHDFWKDNAESKLNHIRPSEDFKFARLLLIICDGLGLAAFTVSGIVISVVAKTTPLWLWGGFFAFLTGAGGGILRDLLSAKRDIVSLRGDIYPEIALFWGILLSVFLTYQSSTIDPDPIRYAVIITIAGAFLTRMAVYFLKIPNIWFRRRNQNQ